MRTTGIIFFTIIFSLLSCRVDSPPELSEGDSYYFPDIPEGFPLPDIPDDNKLTEFRIELGKKLFFDRRFSKNGDVSCGSCHFQDRAFADVTKISTGSDGKMGFRNTMSLTNVAYNTSFFRDGGVPTLELQVLAPLQSEHEMNIDVKDVIDLLKEDAEYVELFDLAYKREPDPFGFTRAIASFERTLISGNSGYDKYVSKRDESALTESEIRGMELFFSDKTNCSKCHSGFNFTNSGFENNGLYEIYADSGRTRVTLKRKDFGKFKVPTLRNVEVTAPYMHDGSLETLEEVLVHYNSGGKDHFNKSELIEPLNLSQTEMFDIVNFLRSLTDTEFLTNPDFES